ncbi:thymidylate synthase [Allorhizocola rhizosphaerae]|uniref:thymidylate synthase n=1 Tax=Allorhizocola rhizosphaerae TaxID=1872709 RepID=UPI000E3BB1D5|nr:thymidylate synthase [Allorhizocola rhizosphaerae]
MTILYGQSVSELFTTAARWLLEHGSHVAPRGMATREILGVHLHLTEPRRRLIHLPPARVLNPAFAVAEAVWIISGSDAAWIFEFNRQLARYADVGVLQGAYGPRLRRWHGVDQLDRVRRQLLHDPDTRRGVVTLFDPAKDHSGHSDVPCTLGFRFFLRGGRLHMHTTMRSQDLWLGFPYDIFTFTLIHELMAGWVGAELGEYRHSVDSLHLYAEHFEIAASLPALGGGEAMDPVTVAWEELDSTLAAVISADFAVLGDSHWALFAQIMGGYRRWKAGERDTARLLAATMPGLLGEALRGWYEHLAPAQAVIPG